MTGSCFHYFCQTWSSQRDHLLLAMLYNTGARVSEIIGVRVADVILEGTACVHLQGKGRKQRSVPLWKTTTQEVRVWLRLNPTRRGEAALLPNRDGCVMTRCNVAQRLDLAVVRASEQLPRSGLLDGCIGLAQPSISLSEKSRKSSFSRTA